MIYRTIQNLDNKQVRFSNVSGFRVSRIWIPTTQEFLVKPKIYIWQKPQQVAAKGHTSLEAFLKELTYNGEETLISIVNKYRRSGVPTRDSSSRRILKVGVLSRVKAD